MAGRLRSQFCVRVRQRMWRSGHTFACVIALDAREVASPIAQCPRPQADTHRRSHDRALHQEGVGVPGRDGSATAGAATAGALWRWRGAV